MGDEKFICPKLNLLKIAQNGKNMITIIFVYNPGYLPVILPPPHKNGQEYNLKGKHPNSMNGTQHYVVNIVYVTGKR